MKSAVIRLSLLFLFNVNLLLSSLFISWQLNKNADYFYPFFYDKLAIAEHIEKYTPYNQYKKNYHEVGPAEHKRVFSEMVEIIHGHGIGANELSYYAKSGERIDTVLTQAEAKHLQEVASVVTIFTWLGLFNLAMTLVIVYLSLQKKNLWPSFKKVLAISFVGFLLCALVFLLVGFNKVFYQFHVLLFSKSQWLFSYRESLLIVLTKSPQLFALMAAMIFFPAFVFYMFFMFCLCQFQDR